MLSHISFTFSINAIVPEFPGYGNYCGYPTEPKLFNDSLTAFEYMVDKMKISNNNIILFGRSLGSSLLLIWLAKEIVLL